jgi:hypothetical protein
LTTKLATCHPERRHYAHGLCGPCYNKRWAENHVEERRAQSSAKWAAIPVDARPKGKKCEHGRFQYYCKDCKGAGICEHKRVRCRCRKCGTGSQICQHKKDRRKCIECRGPNICTHGRYRYVCKECGGLPVLAFCLFRNAKARAKKKKVPFNLTVEEILALIGDGKCPIFGTPYNLSGRRVNDTSANLDRTFPDLGYTKQNCVVMSNLANRIKTNATPAEVRKVLKWMEENVEPIVFDEPDLLD